ncbi:right-handed parallel beta-helix repeat-containing protein [Synergistaceae bacterium OttesenSCG-928-I11]|nr:right-handed parallel beta-helix repeat-containing protein [Synergistaceae bacterium OttesenSCG-928-I11]
MKKLLLALILCMLVTSSASAAGLARIAVMGTGVNIRAEAGPKSSVLTQAHEPDVFIAHDLTVKNKSDGSEWYRILFKVEKSGNLTDMREAIQDANYPYISARFVKSSPLEEGDQAKIQKLQGKQPNIKPREPEVKTVRVRNAKEFIEALGSDTTIVMEFGEYNLSEWDILAPMRGGKHTDLKKGVFWEQIYDGGELTLKGVKNLTIKTASDLGAGILVDPRYAFVLHFTGCSNITIEGVTAGHSEGGYCEGGVFGFTNSSGIKISNTEMFGCGTEGLKLADARDVTVKNSAIYECTYDIMTIRRCKNISFDGCVFRDNEEFTMVNISSTSDVSFTNCRFADNRGQMFGVTDDSKDISVKNSLFTGNTDPSMASSPNVSFMNCKFEN